MQKVSKIFIILCFSLILQAEFVVKSYQMFKNQNMVKQSYEQSCGASSLATLINLIDKQKLNELDVLKLISQKDLNTDMVSFLDLEKAIKKLDFQSKSYLATRVLLDSLIDIPLLVKIGDDPRYPHFVII